MPLGAPMQLPPCCTYFHRTAAYIFEEMAVSLDRTRKNTAALNTTTTTSNTTSTTSPNQTIPAVATAPSSRGTVSSRGGQKRHGVVLTILLSCVAVSFIFQVRDLRTLTPHASLPYYDFSPLVGQLGMYDWSYHGKINHEGGIPQPPLSPHYMLPKAMAPPDAAATAGTSTDSLVIFVLSRNDAFTRRQVIRDTWAKGCTNVYFVVGTFCTLPPAVRALDEGGSQLCQVKPSVLHEQFAVASWDYLTSTVRPNQAKLHQEQERYHDILVMDSPDVYRHLPKKIKAMYSYVDRYLPSSVQWVLKADDDMFVRPKMLQKYIDKLVRTKKLYPSQPTMLGKIPLKGNAATGGKWKEVVQFPSGKEYPRFPLGSAGHLVSRPIVEYVSKYQETLFEYQGEDASLGIWLGAGTHPNAPNPPVASAVPKVRYLPSSVMKNAGTCTSKGIFVLGHDFKDDGLKKCQAFWDRQEKLQNLKQTKQLTTKKPALEPTTVAKTAIKTALKKSSLVNETLATTGNNMKPEPRRKNPTNVQSSNGKQGTTLRPQSYEQLKQRPPIIVPSTKKKQETRTTKKATKPMTAKTTTTGRLQIPPAKRVDANTMF